MWAWSPTLPSNGDMSWKHSLYEYWQYHLLSHHVNQVYIGEGSDKNVWFRMRSHLHRKHWRSRQTETSPPRSCGRWCRSDHPRHTPPPPPLCRRPGDKRHSHNVKKRTGTNSHKKKTLIVFVNSLWRPASAEQRAGDPPALTISTALNCPSVSVCLEHKNTPSHCSHTKITKMLCLILLMASRVLFKLHIIRQSEIFF